VSDSITDELLARLAKKHGVLFPKREVYPPEFDVPRIPELDEWRARVAMAPGGILPMLVPEEAVAWAGVSLEDLSKVVRVGRFSRRKSSVRFWPEDVNAFRKVGRVGYRARAQFPGLCERKGLVYFVEAVGADRVKIGFTSKATAAARVSELQTAAPFELRLITSLAGSLGIEHYLHVELAKERILPTTEWFHLRGEVSDLIDHVQAHGRWP
jgi:hypothetical protein